MYLYYISKMFNKLVKRGEEKKRTLRQRDENEEPFSSERRKKKVIKTRLIL